MKIPIVMAVLGVAFWAYVAHMTRRLTTTQPFRQDALTLQIQRDLLMAHGAKPLDLKTSDNKTIAAMLIERANAHHSLVLCHPYRQNKEFMVPFLELFPDYNLLFFDFRGHGESEKAPISFGIYEYQDVLAAAHCMKERFPQMPLVGLGISMGGASLLHAVITDELFDAIIIDSSFTMLSESLTYALEVRKFPEIVPHFMIPSILTSFEHAVDGKIASMDLKEQLADCKIPLLVMHDTQDGVCPYSYAQELFNSWGGKKRLHTLENTHHAFAFCEKPEEYACIVTDFVSNL